MAGAYCKFCGFRCFVYRIVPDGPEKGWGGHMATCREGMELDLKVLGHTHLTAVNPITEPDLADAIAAEIAGARGRKAAGLAVEAGQFAEFERQVTAMLPDPGQALGADRMTDADWREVGLVLRDRARDWPWVKSYWDKAGEALGRG
jgi:hypothetical protein